MLSIVWASLFIADVSDAGVPLRAGSAVARTAQVASDTYTLAAVTAPNQAYVDSNAKPQVLPLCSTLVTMTASFDICMTHSVACTLTLVFPVTRDGG